MAVTATAGTLPASSVINRLNRCGSRCAKTLTSFGDQLPGSLSQLLLTFVFFLQGERDVRHFFLISKII
jgi:hypothetical protein